MALEWEDGGNTVTLVTAWEKFKAAAQDNSADGVYFFTMQAEANNNIGQMAIGLTSDAETLTDSQAFIADAVGAGFYSGHIYVNGAVVTSLVYESESLFGFKVTMFGGQGFVTFYLDGAEIPDAIDIQLPFTGAVTPTVSGTADIVVTGAFSTSDIADIPAGAVAWFDETVAVVDEPAIVRNDLVFYEAVDNLVDDDTQGGVRSSSEILTDFLNNLFLGVSSIAAVSGKITYKSVHAVVNTDDQSAYLDANIILTKNPDDPNVKIYLVKGTAAGNTRGDMFLSNGVITQTFTDRAYGLLKVGTIGSSTILFSDNNSILPTNLTILASLNNDQLIVDGDIVTAFEDHEITESGIEGNVYEHVGETFDPSAAVPASNTADVPTQSLADTIALIAASSLITFNININGTRDNIDIPVALFDSSTILSFEDLADWINTNYPTHLAGGHSNVVFSWNGTAFVATSNDEVEAPDTTQTRYGTTSFTETLSIEHNGTGSASRLRLEMILGFTTDSFGTPSTAATFVTGTEEVVFRLNTTGSAASELTFSNDGKEIVGVSWSTWGNAAMDTSVALPATSFSYYFEAELVAAGTSWEVGLTDQATITTTAGTDENGASIIYFNSTLYFYADNILTQTTQHTLVDGDVIGINIEREYAGSLSIVFSWYLNGVLQSPEYLYTGAVAYVSLAAKLDSTLRVRTLATEIEFMPASSEAIETSASILPFAPVTFIEVTNVNDNKRLNSDHFTTDLEAGTVTIDPAMIHEDRYGNALDSSSDYIIKFRRSTIYSASGVTAVEMNFPTTYQWGENAYVCANMLLGDLQSGVPVEFSQEIFDSNDPVWQDTIDGSASLAQYNSAGFPVEVVNSSAVTERWAIQYIDSSNVRVIGETLGVLIASAPVTSDVAPINTATGLPYFIMRAGGFGSGASIGNAIRINTTGAAHQFWALRDVAAGALANTEDSFNWEIRGDI